MIFTCPDCECEDFPHCCQRGCEWCTLAEDIAYERPYGLQGCNHAEMLEVVLHVRSIWNEQLDTLSSAEKKMLVKWMTVSRKLRGELFQ